MTKSGFQRLKDDGEIAREESFDGLVNKEPTEPSPPPYEDLQRQQRLVMSVTRFHSAPICCGVTARTWTKIGIIINMSFWGFLFAIMSLYLLGLLTISPQDQLGENSQAVWNSLQEGGGYLAILTTLTGLFFLLTILALHGVNTNNSCLMTLWVAIQLIGTAEEGFRFMVLTYAALYGGVAASYFLCSFVSMAVNIFFLHVTVKCRDEIVRGKVINLISYQPPV